MTTKRTNWIVGVIAVCILLTLLAAAVQRARDNARKTMSANNLKQIGLGLHHYHGAYKSFPPGATIDRDGTALQGWIYPTIPYMESGPTFSLIDRNEAWDTGINRYRSMTGFWWCQIPGVREVATREGFYVTHYMANPSLFHRNSNRSMSDIHRGTSHSWLAGEVEGAYQPWAYPFNWRELRLPFNETGASFGRPTGDGVLLLRADAAVDFIANSIEPAVLDAITNNPPLPDASLRDVPARSFELVHERDTFRWEYRPLYEVEEEGPDVIACVNTSGQAEFLEIRHNHHGLSRGVYGDDIRAAIRFYPDAKIFLLPIPLDDQTARVLSHMTAIEHLYAPVLILSRKGLKSLSRLRTLRSIETPSQMPEEQLRQLQAALPRCKFVTRR